MLGKGMWSISGKILVPTHLFFYKNRLKTRMPLINKKIVNVCDPLMVPLCLFTYKCQKVYLSTHCIIFM